ncbi:MAG TPA: YheU family protein [Smithella sp.]|nr:YheU family protein [Smithella sp.]MDM7987803.1 YheU family protein [Smithella sp.]HNY50460.1 YheU family protein [Smithella sp.]HOG90089.1 YheU family protein [Smithella sp.]HOU50959.1 YheU family protein [Smithella sp.]
MSIHIIPIKKLSATALRGVIEEFITRSVTDYGTVEASLDTKFKQVKNQLKNGTAVLVFDDQTETTNIFPADDPALKKIEAMHENLEKQEKFLAE